MVINLKPESDAEEITLPARSIDITSSLTGKVFVNLNEEVTLTAVLYNFREDDVYTFQWQYYDRASRMYVDIPEATDSTFVYYVNDDNISNTWRLVVTVLNEI